MKLSVLTVHAVKRDGALLLTAILFSLAPTAGGVLFSRLLPPPDPAPAIITSRTAAAVSERIGLRQRINERIAREPSRGAAETLR